MFVRSSLAVLLLVPPSLLADDAEKSPPKQTLIEISEETSYLTEPLDDEGFVDYVKAVDQRAAKGVTPENNFEVVVRRVMGPGEISEQMLEEYYRRIGIAKGDGPFLEDFTEYHAENARSQEERDALFKEYEKLLDGPYRAADHPRAVKWLEASKAHLDAIVEGTKRPRYYTPYIGGGDLGVEGLEGPGPQMIALLLPSVQGLRSLARDLQIRINLRIAEGELEAAWEDIHAMYRLGRHPGQGLTLIEALVGYAIEGMAFQSTSELLGHPEIGDELLARIGTDLKGLPPLATMADKIDRGERLMGLDCIQALARAGQGGLPGMLNLLNDLSAITEPVDAIAEHADPAFATTFVAVDDEKTPPAADERPKELTINWNVTARIMNRWYDRLVAASREGDFAKRKAAFESLNEDIKELAAKARNGQQLWLELIGGQPRDKIGEMMGNILVSLLLPAVETATKAEHQAIARIDVLEVAIATERYRRAEGRLPARLADLVPGRLARVPIDGMNGKPLQYRTDDGEFVVYSVGRNGEDDEGRDYADREHAIADDQDVDWDDIAVRLQRR